MVVAVPAVIVRTIETTIVTSAGDITVMRTARVVITDIDLIDTAPGPLCRPKTVAVIVRIRVGETSGTTAMTETEGTEIAETEHAGMNETAGIILAETIGITTSPGIAMTTDVEIHISADDHHRAPLGQKPTATPEATGTTLTGHLQLLAPAWIGPATDNRTATPTATLLLTPTTPPEN